MQKKKLIRLKSFEKWTFEEVEDKFEIKRVPSLYALETWISVQNPISDAERAILEERKNFAVFHIVEWREIDLMAQLIIPILNLVNFYTTAYRIFYDAPVRIQLNENEEIAGKLDCVVARGKINPKQPFLLIQEYKSEKFKDSDPLGQLLIAMVAAQKTDRYLAADHPRYGAYINGRNWFFVVLHGSEYAVSNAFNATKDDIFRIASILKAAKGYVEHDVEAHLVAEEAQAPYAPSRYAG
jgi:hypothetical protein